MTVPPFVNCAIIRFTPQMTRIPNRNPNLYGPGPFIRRGRGPAALPPLQGLARVALQGAVMGAVAAMAFKKFHSDPMMRDIKEFYEEND